MPEAYVRDNAAMTFHLLDAVREEAPAAAVMVAASSELYGPPAQLPVDESAPLRPQNPYAVSKAGADLLAGFFADAHGLRVVRARAFNHAGPGQVPIYAIASFTRQIAAGIVAGEETVRVVTGNPDARRDYTDVRDVVRAYRSLAAGASPGIYNVCSGRPASAAELVEALGRVAGMGVSHEVDPKLRRAHEVMEVRGSYERLHGATGWEPEIALEQTLADTVAWWREEIRAGRAGARVHE
jgi:GDP-4-dehydro-6-deoxy-D-mannose reductase